MAIDFDELIWLLENDRPTALLRLEIERATGQIKAALWQSPADLDRAKLLISKRMGLRICLGEVKVKLKKPVVRIVELAAAA